MINRCDVPIRVVIDQTLTQSAINIAIELLHAAGVQRLEVDPSSQTSSLKLSEKHQVPRSYHPLEAFTTLTTSSITGTSMSTPTTVASAAPD